MIENKMELFTRIKEEYSHSKDLTMVKTKSVFGVDASSLSSDVREKYIITDEFYKVLNERKDNLALVQKLRPINSGTVMYVEV